MNTNKTELILLVVASVLVGCAGTQEAARDNQKIHAPTQVSRTQQVETYGRELPALLKLPPDRIRVEPGTEVIQVVIVGVVASAERQAILEKFQEYMWQYADTHQETSMARLFFKD